jgi:hypothetical protein
MTFTATPSQGSALSSWGGACPGTSTTCTIIITADASISATFDLTDTYISQSGGGTGESCSSPLDASWFNDSSNWGSGPNQIGPGDIIHLCGTISSYLAFQGSGAAGSPITIYFEPGAKMSAPTGAGISASSQSYLIIDGGTKTDGSQNGIIEATDNGTQLGNHFGFTAINLYFVNNVEVKNLVMRGMYVRTPNSSDATEGGAGISYSGSSHLLIHNNVISDALNGIGGVYGAGVTDIKVHSNNISRTRWGIWGGDWPPNVATLSGMELYNNVISGGYVWEGIINGNDWFHVNGIYIWAESGGKVSGLKIYDNIIGGDMGNHVTGWIFGSGGNFCTDNSDPCEIYGNFLYSDLFSYPSNGYIVSRAQKIYNNTIVGNNGSTALDIDGGTLVQNNIIAGNGVNPISIGSQSITTAISRALILGKRLD